MQDLRSHMVSVDENTRQELVAKCQENEWVCRGGFPWQDDPYLEEYPYEFSTIDDLEALRNVFIHGNWAIRQGFIYKDLAFIQQSDGGDEWWTLKHTDDGWLDFESWTFRETAQNQGEFNSAILAMCVASPKECYDHDYMKYASSATLPSLPTDSTDSRASLDARAQNVRSASDALSGVNTLNASTNKKR